MAERKISWGFLFGSPVLLLIGGFGVKEIIEKGIRWEAVLNTSVFLFVGIMMIAMGLGYMDGPELPKTEDTAEEPVISDSEDQSLIETAEITPVQTKEDK